MKQHIVIKIIDSIRKASYFDDVMKIIMTEVKEYSGFECVGMRVENSIGDYPYFLNEGFPDSFLKTESTLCVTDKNGDIVYDSIGNPVLDCMCGNVIRGYYDPRLPFFTEGGSFWTNSTTELLATTSENEMRGHTRNKCNSSGYESVGLFPFNIGRVNIGLLQLNDKRKGLFNKKNIEEYELLAKYLSGIVHNSMIVERARGIESKLKEEISELKNKLKEK